MAIKKKLIAILLVVLIVLAAIPLAGDAVTYAGIPENEEILLTEPDTEELQLEEDNDCEIVLAETYEDVSLCLDPLSCEEGEQLLPVTIDPAEGTVSIEGSGLEESLEDVYALSEEDSFALTGGTDAENRDAVLNYLLEDPCLVYEQEDGTLRAEYPFSLKILFVLLAPGELTDTFGASNAVYDAEGGRYVLQFASQEDAANAYTQLTETYGEESVLIDLPVAPSDLKYDETTNNQTFSSYTASKSLSWGTDVMYMDRLRDWANDNPANGILKVAVIDTGIRVYESSENIINGYGIDASRVYTSLCRAIISSVYNYTALHDQSDSGWSPTKCSYADLDGHGTHVMSTILDGTPDNVKVFAIRDSCLNPNKYNSTTYSNGDIDGIVRAVHQAGEYGAKVVNISQGIDCYDSTSGTYTGYHGKGITSMDTITFNTFAYYNNEIARYADAYDLCIVASAGNSGADSGSIMHFPGMNNGVIEVSNVYLQNSVYSLYSTSNYGDNVSFCAPGRSIVGAGYNWDTHSACYEARTGTSMAAPHITAALAIIRLYYPEFSHLDAVEFLTEFCKDLGASGKDNYYGYGLPQFKTMLTATFVYNDGYTGSQSVSVPKGMPLPRPENPERWGYSFGGWFTDTACTKAYDFSQPVKSSPKLYAKWNRIYKQVTFNYNGHGGTTHTINVPLGEDIPRPADPSESGWEFRGWYWDSEEFTFSTPVYENMTLLAKWRPLPTGVTLNKTSLELTCGKSSTLSATVKPSGANKKVTWSSSNPSVATVSSSGVVKAKTYGKATITAKTSNGKKATCKVQTRFTDAVRGEISNAKFDAIYWVADNKITGEKVTFGTDDCMTRGQFVRFLYRYAGNPTVTESMKKKYGNKFWDVDSDYTHYNAIVWAVSKGLIQGYANGAFQPNDTLTRNNVATILWKYAGSPNVKNADHPFSDVKKSVCIAWGKNKGIFTGTKFYPKDECLRGSFAVFLHRYDIKIGN